MTPFLNSGVIKTVTVRILHPHQDTKEVQVADHMFQRRTASLEGPLASLLAQGWVALGPGPFSCFWGSSFRWAGAALWSSLAKAGALAHVPPWICLRFSKQKFLPLKCTPYPRLSLSQSLSEILSKFSTTFLRVDGFRFGDFKIGSCSISLKPFQSIVVIGSFCALPKTWSLTWARSPLTLQWRVGPT